MEFRFNERYDGNTKKHCTSDVKYDSIKEINIKKAEKRLVEKPVI